MRIGPLILLFVFLLQFFPSVGTAMSCCNEFWQKEEITMDQSHICCQNDVKDNLPIDNQEEKDCCGDNCHCITSSSIFTFISDTQSYKTIGFFGLRQNHHYSGLIGFNYNQQLFHPPAY